jgi:hypothetical protein
VSDWEREILIFHLDRCVRKVESILPWIIVAFLWVSKRFRCCDLLFHVVSKELSKEKRGGRGGGEEERRVSLLFQNFSFFF